MATFGDISGISEICGRSNGAHNRTNFLDCVNFAKDAVVRSKSF